MSQSVAQPNINVIAGQNGMFCKFCEKDNILMINFPQQKEDEKKVSQSDSLDEERIAEIDNLCADCFAYWIKIFWTHPFNGTVIRREDMPEIITQVCPVDNSSEKEDFLILIQKVYGASDAVLDLLEDDLSDISDAELRTRLDGITTYEEFMSDDLFTRIPEIEPHKDAVETGDID